MSNVDEARLSAYEMGYYDSHSDIQNGREYSLDLRDQRAREYCSRHRSSDIRIIFLDMDGVINNATDSDRHIIDNRGYLYSPRCVSLLNELTDSTGAKIVVSSVWRLGKTVEELQELCKAIGITGEIIDKTPSFNEHWSMRGNEIYSWISSNSDIVGSPYEFRRYVILDDDSDMLLWQKDNYVNCDPTIGMTDRTVFKAQAILFNAPCEDTGQEYA